MAEFPELYNEEKEIDNCRVEEDEEDDDDEDDDPVDPTPKVSPFISLSPSSKKSANRPPVNTQQRSTNNVQNVLHCGETKEGKFRAVLA